MDDSHAIGVTRNSPPPAQISKSSLPSPLPTLSPPLAPSLPLHASLPFPFPTPSHPFLPSPSFPPLTRNSSGDEIANVNFLYDDIVHVLQNTIDSCINSATDRRRYVLECMFTKLSEITQYNGHYAVRGHSRSPILVPIERSYIYDFLLVINTN